MKTRAVLDGDQWVINGRKIWISNARGRRLHHRHGPRRQRCAAGRHHSFIVERARPASSSSARSRCWAAARPTRSCSRIAVSRGLGARRGRQGLCADAAAAAHAAARDGIDLHRHRPARARHAVRTRQAARDVRRQARRPPGDPVVDRRYLDAHACLPADGARCRRQDRPRRGRPPRSLDDQGVRDRDGL